MLKYDIMHGFQEKEYNKNQQGNYIIPLKHIPSKIKFHKLTKLNPNYYDTELYQALKTNIEQNGYDENIPILIYRGKIVDGWHRVTACKELGIDSIIAKELPYKMALRDVEQLVLRLEVRRQMTKTQLAIKAWKAWKSGEYKSIKESASMTGVSENSIKAVSQVADWGDIGWIDDLYKGKKVQYGDGLKYTDSIFTIKSFLVKQKKDKSKKILEPQMSDDDKNKISDTIWAILNSQKISIADGKDIIRKLYNKISSIEEAMLSGSKSD